MDVLGSKEVQEACQDIDIREENVSHSNCQPLPDVFQTGKITKAEMSTQAHRWLLLLTVLAD